MLENNPQKTTSEEIKEQQVSVKPRKVHEISQEALEERQLLEGLLLQRTEDHVQEAARLKRQREEEEFELRSGVKISLKQINDYVTANRQPYTPMFPNAVPFFQEMYRLLEWDDKDPNNYTKPAVVGSFITELIYNRFNKDVLPALQTLAMPGGIRLHKFFQFLTNEGQEKLEKFRDEAIALMKTSSTWYEFRVKYGKQYGLPVQKAMFEKYNETNGQATADA